jgi:hypothetical protein
MGARVIEPAEGKLLATTESAIEEALLLVQYLRNESKTWIPRITV